MKRSAILVGVALALLGCSDDDPFFDVRVSSINGGGPVIADVQVYDRQRMVFVIPEDVVVAEFTNKTRSDLVITDPSSFLHDFHLQGYTVTWRYAGGTDPALATFDFSQFNFLGATSAIVPVGTTVPVGVLVAPFGMKVVSPIVDLRGGGELSLIADIDFVGTRAITSEAEIHIPVSILVNFADFADET